MREAGLPLPIFVVGPTATGKTDAAIALALLLQSASSKQSCSTCGEIVNADSVQVYRGLDIGSAKPTEEERQGVPFHLIDIVDPDDTYTVADWKHQAGSAIEHILGRGGRPIVCGGTGMYVRALLDDWTLAATPADAALRAMLNEEKERVGAPALHARLSEQDPIAAARLHPNDAVRIIRALEVFMATGRPISSFQAEDMMRRVERPALRIGLDLPRPDLYARINLRVDRMMRRGFIAEVSHLMSQGFAAGEGALGSLGYKEISTLLAHHHAQYPDSATLIQVAETIKQNTRRFAKRQQTWFRADQRIHWIDVSEMTSRDVAIQIAKFLPLIEER